MKLISASIPQLYHLFAEYPWEIYLTSLCLSFLLCKVSNSRAYIIDLLLRLNWVTYILKIVFIIVIAVIIVTITTINQLLIRYSIIQFPYL